jgi:small conductance mechanosensitive channel
MNFISGVMILVSRQFTIGDFIKVGSTIGKVMEIQTRATILKAIDGTKVIVPNSEIFTSQVVSFTTNPLRRVTIPLYVSYDTDIRYAMKIALGVLKKHPKIVKKPGPSVIVSNYGDSTIDLTARFWIGSRDGWFKVKSEMMHKMLEEIQAAGIVVPFNITHIENEQDTAEYVKQMNEIAKKRVEEMKEAKLSKAIQEDAAKSAASGNGNGSQNPAVASAAPLATAAVPIEPPGAYSDQEEIDGIA